eukprot:359108-Chlamydomonas_euryale.AAC.21
MCACVLGGLRAKQRQELLGDFLHAGIRWSVPRWRRPTARVGAQVPTCACAGTESLTCVRLDKVPNLRGVMGEGQMEASERA